MEYGKYNSKIALLKKLTLPYIESSYLELENYF